MESLALSPKMLKCNACLLKILMGLGAEEGGAAPEEFRGGQVAATLSALAQNSGSIGRGEGAGSSDAADPDGVGDDFLRR